jgi:hypothetical protein
MNKPGPQAAHYMFTERTKRIELGLPHTTLSDIVNDWLIESGPRHGYAAPGEHALKIVEKDLV